MNNFKYIFLILFMSLQANSSMLSEKDMYCVLRAECDKASWKFLIYAPKLAQYECAEKHDGGYTDNFIKEVKPEDLISFISYQYQNLYRFYDPKDSQDRISELNNLKPTDILSTVPEINNIFSKTGDQHVYFRQYDGYSQAAYKTPIVLPVAFDFMREKGKSRVYVSDKLFDLKYVPTPEIPGLANVSCENKYAAFLNTKIQNQTNNIEIGDELIEYNGVSIEQVLNTHNSALNKNIDMTSENVTKLYLKNINFMTELVAPVSFKIKKKNGSILSTTLDWMDLTQSNILTITEGRGFYYSFLKNNISSYSRAIFSFPNWGTLTNTHAIEKKSYIYGYKLGWFFDNYSSFSNDPVSIYKSLSDDLEPSSLVDKKGVVIDLRGNRGGKIFDAHILARAFADHPIEPLYYDSRVNEDIKRIVDFNPDTFSDLYKKSFSEAYAKGLSLTVPSPKFDSARVNQLGQLYKTKVIVLVDSQCFSACEVFVASLKGQPNIKIIGHGDKTTAGGGAAVWNMSEFYYRWPTTAPTLNFPYNPQINFSFSFEANYQRLSDGSLKLIQGHGIEVDQVIDKTYNDIVNDDADLRENLLKVFDTF